MPYVNRETLSVSSRRRRWWQDDSEEDPAPQERSHVRDAIGRGRRYISSSRAVGYGGDELDYDWDMTTFFAPSPPAPPSVLDNKMGSQWLESCEREHTYHCKSRTTWTKATAGGPIWLIDVGRYRIVPAEDGVKYATLSYVWGSRNDLQLTQTNVETLKQRGALSNVPGTIRDAIRLVDKDLNLEYLWVDSLCIIQDDEQHKVAQIARMAEIYANAEVTIVAAYGNNAEAGLRPQVRQSPWELSLDWLRETRTTSGSSLYSFKTQMLEQSPWMGRAWTLQELVFSRRAIIFTENLVFWECHCATWHNGLTTLPPRGKCFSRFSVSAHGLQHSPWPDLVEYSELVKNYSARDLTFQNDARVAFAGITTTYSKVFTNGFHFGLPEMFFDIALLWIPHADLIARDREHFPSWSWMGWKGAVNLAKWNDGFDYLVHSYRWSTSRTIIMIGKWHSAVTVDGPWSPMNVCRTTYYAGDDALNLETNLPEGWSSKTTSDNSPVYHHVSDPKTEFRYPIPIVDPRAPAPAPDPSPGRDAFYLRFRSTHGFFTIHTSSRTRQIGHERNNDKPRAATIYHDAIQIGTLQVNHSQDLADISTVGGSREKQEFVAISMIQHDTSKKPGSKIDSYHVMWIVRDENGYAHRRGLGEVWKGHWDRFAEGEEVDVILR